MTHTLKHAESRTTETTLSDVVTESLAYVSGLDVSQVVPDMPLIELGIDSVSAVSCIVVLEAKLRITIPQESSAQLFSSERVSDFIEQLHLLATGTAPWGYND